MGARMLKSRHLIILSSSVADLLARHRAPRLSTPPQQPATGRHGAPRFWPQNPANLLKSVLPPAQDCQIAYLGTLVDSVEPKRYQGLSAEVTRGDQRPSKCNLNSSQTCHQASKKTSIQASKHPSIQASGLRGRRQRR